MGFLRRLLGTEAPPPAPRRGAPPPSQGQALERYRYMLQTAPPETIEQAHAEAFAKLGPDQRRAVLAELARTAPPAERASVEATRVEDTSSLARAATRAEIRQPGAMERMMGGAGLGFGSSLLTSFAIGFAGGVVANSFFSALGGFGHDAGAPEAESGAAEDEYAGDAELADFGERGSGYDPGANEGSDYDAGGFDGGGDFEV